MSANYNGSQIGVPYVRTSQLVIDWPDNNKKPRASIVQCTAVKLADGTIRELDKLPQVDVELDFAVDGNTPVPMISPEDASPLGADTTLNQAFVAVLAIVHDRQLKAEATA
jgi:hypothetical protein